MQKKTIVKTVASVAILGLSVWGASGLVGGHDVTYQIPGPYSAENTNDFSTVKVDMTIKGETITDCAITSSGDADLLTDEIRTQWADAIVEAQSADTDAITGASLTYSAGSVKACVDDILVQAGLKDASEIEAPAQASADSGDVSAALPAIAVSMGANKENSYVTDYLEQDPYLINIYEGYGFAKDYGSARGHEYCLEDVAKTQRPHPKANCLTCKTPDLHKMIAEEGVGVYGKDFDEVMAQTTNNVNCYTCHGDDGGNGGKLEVTHQYVNEALGEHVSDIKPATLSCGQCHIEYYFTPADSEAMMPYDSVEAMTPEAILAYYDGMEYKDGTGFYDWIQESTGTKLLKAQHPEMETVLQGKHAAMLSCADCHMAPETTESGVAYHNHKLVSPLESEALLETCAACHRDTDMAGFVHGIQERVTARETEVGNKLSGMKDKLAEAAQSGEWSEEDLDAVRKLHREAQWYFDFCYVENSEGAHNSQLSMRCLDTSDALIDQALALLGETVEASAPAAEPEAKAGNLVDGIYTAEAVNDFSTVDVYAAVRNGLIDDCVISSSGDNDLLTDELRAEWAQSVVESQSADADAISGASLTFSAASVKEAVDDILARAAGSEAGAEAEEKAGNLVDGIYTAEAVNDFSTVDVYAAVRNGLIDDCVISSSGDNDLLTDELRAEWAQSIVESQSADADAISGASLTFSAASVKEAVDDILARAAGPEAGAEAEEKAGNLVDGIYTAEAVNDFSTVDVYAAVRNGLIDDCVISSSGDNDLLTDELRAEWAQSIVESQSADADAISGASLTFSAASVKEAVDDILARAAGSEAEAEAPAEAGDASKYMRPRPVFTAAASEEKPAETPAEAPAEALAEAGDASKYMRPRPVFTASDEPAEIGEPAAPIEDEAPAEAGDALKYMRPRPVFTASDEPAEIGEPAAPIEDEAPAEAGDASKYMRPRPAFTAEG